MRAKIFLPQSYIDLNNTNYAKDMHKEWHILLIGVGATLLGFVLLAATTKLLSYLF